MIFLIGFMACGKTTLGKALERAFPGELSFVDLDEYIESKAGKTVRAIFADEGEAAFRRMESEAIAEVAERYSLVACGGGTPCHGRNLELMLSRGTVVWLEASRERSVSRLIAFQAQRPLLNGLSPDEIGAYYDRTLAERTPYYSQAHRRFDSTYLENEEEIAATVDRFAKEFLT